MIHDNIEFFNCCEIKSDGTILRFKEDLILGLGYKEHQRGRFYGYRSIGVELRFKTNAKFFDISLEAYKEDCRVYVFYGDYMDKSYTLEHGKVTTLHIEIPEKMINNFHRLPKGGFANDLIRVIIGYPGYIKYKGINTFGNDILVPNEDDVPKKSLVIYGSSISHGSEALEYVNSYSFILSRILNINIYNKAIPGSCLAEKDMIDYVASIPADNYFVEFGINVLRQYSLEEYINHLNYIVNKIKNLKFTSVFMCGAMLEEDIAKTRFDEFREYAKNVEGFIDPDNILTRFEALTTDLLHPSDFGQMLIAINLSKYF